MSADFCEKMVDCGEAERPCFEPKHEVIHGVVLCRFHARMVRDQWSLGISPKVRTSGGYVDLARPTFAPPPRNRVLR